MLTLEEAIKHCEEKEKELREQPLKERMDIEDVAACEECATEHEQLAAWLTELQERREADRWIPVSEKLPELYGEYLITDLDGDVRKDTYNDYFKKFNAEKHVIAWKPLPKPYESEAENGNSNQDP